MEEKFKNLVNTILEAENRESRVTAGARKNLENKINKTRTKLNPNYVKEMKKIVSSGDTPDISKLFNSLGDKLKNQEVDLSKSSFEERKRFLEGLGINYENAKKNYKEYPLGVSSDIDTILMSGESSEQGFVNFLTDKILSFANEKNKKKPGGTKIHEAFGPIRDAYVYSKGSHPIDRMNQYQDQEETIGTSKKDSKKTTSPGIRYFEEFLQNPKIKEILSNKLVPKNKKIIYKTLENGVPKEYDKIPEGIIATSIIGNKSKIKDESGQARVDSEYSKKTREAFYNLFLEKLLDLVNSSNEVKRFYRAVNSDGFKEYVPNIQAGLLKAYQSGNIPKENPFTGENRVMGLIQAVADENKKSENPGPTANVARADDMQIGDKGNLEKADSLKRGESKSIDLVVSVPYASGNEWVRNNFLIQLKTTWSSASKEPVKEIRDFLMREKVSINLSNGQKSIATTMAVVDGKKWRDHLLGTPPSKRFISKETNDNFTSALNENEKKYISSTVIKYADASMTVSRGLFTEEFVKYLYKISTKLVLTVDPKKGNFEKNISDSVYTEALKTEIVRNNESENFKLIISDFYNSLLKIKKFIQNNRMAGLKEITAAVENIKKIKDVNVSNPNPLDDLKKKGITFNSVVSLDRKTLKARANNIRDRK